MRIATIIGICLLLALSTAAYSADDTKVKRKSKKAKSAVGEKRTKGKDATKTKKPPFEVGDKVKAPKNAIMLFDGKKVGALIPDGSDKDKKFTWLIKDGYMEVVTGAGSLVTKDAYNDFRLHLQFATPQMPPEKTGQARGNSGVYIQRRYEVQILDSYGDEPVKNSCASIYKFKAADSNQCRKPTEWQSYDILFRAARWDGKGKDAKKTENARISVWHNGVLVHDDVEIPNKTGAGKPEGVEPGPILLQNHKDKVRFKDVWIVKM